MKKSGAPASGDLVKIRQGSGYADWSGYPEGPYLVVNERGIEVQLLLFMHGGSPIWVRRDCLDIVSTA